MGGYIPLFILSYKITYSYMFYIILEGNNILHIEI